LTEERVRSVNGRNFTNMSERSPQPRPLTGNSFLNAYDKFVDRLLNETEEKEAAARMQSMREEFRCSVDDVVRELAQERGIPVRAIDHLRGSIIINGSDAHLLRWRIGAAIAEARNYVKKQGL
jgi:hypothetical protein